MKDFREFSEREMIERIKKSANYAKVMDLIQKNVVFRGDVSYISVSDTCITYYSPGSINGCFFVYEWNNIAKMKPSEQKAFAYAIYEGLGPGYTITLHEGDEGCSFWSDYHIKKTVDYKHAWE